jgi:hypothetical protein
MRSPVITSLPSVLLLIFLVARCCAAPSLLANGGFEGDYTPASGSATADVTGVVAPGWSDNSNWAKTTIIYARDTAGVHGGSACQKITLQPTPGGYAGQGVAQFVQPLSTTAPTFYRGGAWMRSQTPIDVSLSIRKLDPPYTLYIYHLFHLTAQWQYCPLRGLAPAASNIFLVRTVTPGTFWIDDADLAGAPATSQFDNPGFEDGFTNVQDESTNGPDFGMPPPPMPTSVTGQIGSGWTDDSSSVPSIVRYAAGNAGAHSGQSCQKVTLEKWSFRLQHEFLVNQGRSYAASVWLRSDNPAKVELSLRIPDDTAFASVVATATPTWRRFTCWGAAPASMIGSLDIRSSTSGAYWIDDASIREGTAHPTTPEPADQIRYQPIAPTFFGMTVHSLNTPWPSVPIGAVRTWDSNNVAWKNLEPARGVYNWSALDGQVARDLQHGTDVMYTIGLTPLWASSRPTEKSAYGPGNAAEPSNLEYWREFLTALGARYKGKIHYYEIINEPDNYPDFFSGTPAQLAQMTRIAYKVLKQQDPSCAILSPAITFHLDYWEDYLLAGGGDSADVISYHGYADTPEVSYQDALALRRLLLRFGQQNKPMFDSEMGWGDVGQPQNFTDPSKPPYTLADPNPDNYRDPAGYLARSYLLTAAEGVPRLYWYAWDNHGWCRLWTTEQDNVTVTAAGKAYAAIQPWLLGATVVSCDNRPDGTWIETLRTARGQTTHAVWSPDATVQFTVPASWSASSVETVAGASSGLPADRTISVGPEPLLVE